MPRSLRGSSLLLPHDTMLRSDPTESRLSPLSPGVTRVLNIRGSGLFSPVHNRMLCLLCVCSSHLLAVILLCITTTIYFVFLFPLNNSTAGISINPPLMYSIFFLAYNNILKISKIATKTALPQNKQISPADKTKLRDIIRYLLCTVMPCYNKSNSP